MMGLEEHLLGMFREDFEFSDMPSHLGSTAPARAPEPVMAEAASAVAVAVAEAAPSAPVWLAEAEKELGKIPFFVRGKARRNTERFALDRGLATITVETMYDAKAYFSR
jgi:light-independent protochlorophyllide reductase subunit B